MKKLISILSVALVIAGLSISCSKDDSSSNGGGSSSGSSSSSSSATSSLAGTTWATADLLGFGTLTLSFSANDCTAKITNGSKVESCTYPYTFSGNTMNTKVKMSVWSGGEEQEATGTVSGNNMNFKLSKNGSNYALSKK